jgi:uncharacterized protein YqgC (DUF456 family)
MEWQAITLASFFALIGLACVVLIPFGPPGLWMLLGFAVLVELGDTWVVPPPDETTFGWGLLALCGGLGVVGEVVEAGAGAAGTRMGGGTRRGMWGAILGGILGAVVFTVLLPLPLVGTLVGALLGTFAGALVAETTGQESRDRPTSHNVRAAFAATVGRLAGTLGKTMVAVVIWILLVWNAFEL